jgi:hypothetical protein
VTRLMGGVIAFSAGVVLVGVAVLVARASGDDLRLIQGCVAIVVAGVGAAVVMSQTIYVGAAPTRDATGATPVAPGDADDVGGERPDERVQFAYPAVETLSPQRGRHLRWRRYSVYPLIACLPALAALLLSLR